MRWVWHDVYMERERGREGDIETFFVRRPEEKRPIEC
jgi:hypothetical protein